LHERLTARFVDRRTSVLMRRLRENAMLETEITKTGEVVVEAHKIGRLDGFQFAADAAGAGHDAKALRTAAQKALAGEIDARAARLSSAPDDHFVLAGDGAIRWLGEAVGKMIAGDEILRPRARIIADEQLTGASRDAVQARLDLWLKAHIEKLLGPLFALGSAEDVTGIARGVAYQIIEGLGVLERHRVADDVKSLDQTARATLRKYGVRFGAYHIYLPQILKPAARALAVQLWALKEGGPDIKGLDEVPHLAASGRTSFPADKAVPKSLYRTVGYRVCGERAVRVDILERLADLIRPALAWRPGAPGERPAGAIDGAGFTVTVAMTSLTGSSGEDFAGVLRSLGYRMEKRPKPAEPAPSAEPSAEPAADAATATEQATPADQASREAPAADTPVEAPGIADVVAAGTAPVAPEAVEAAAPAVETPPVEPVAAPMAEGTAPIVTEEASSVAEASAAPESVAAPEAASAEPEFIEVWRPGRPEGERRPRRPQTPRRGERQARPPQAAAAAAPAEAGAEAPAAATGAPAPDGPRHGRKGRREGGEREDRRERRPDQPQRARSGDRPERGDRPGGGRGRPGGKDRDRDRDRGEPREWRDPKERRGREPDPNSPFAKLAALKEQLEGNK
jgi:ATP-dependent RNA helicase SUPV3L1/SUV3